MLSIQDYFQVQNVFLNDGNRPYCEDCSYIDTVTEMTNRMQQRIHRQALPDRFSWAL